MTAYLIVRAEVTAADRDAFDRWYETEHLPDAKVAFQALSTWRGWSDDDPGIHLALYEFPDLARARAVATSDAMAAMRAEFDRAWGERVPRSRDIVEVRQSL